MADAGGFADDDTCAVVDEEGRPHAGAGVNVDAGTRVGVLGHHARHQQRPFPQQAVRSPVDGDGVEPGIASDHLVGSGGCGIRLEGKLDVLFQQTVQLGQSGQRARCDALGAPPAGVLVLGDFGAEAVQPQKNQLLQSQLQVAQHLSHSLPRSRVRSRAQHAGAPGSRQDY